MKVAQYGDSTKRQFGETMRKTHGGDTQVFASAAAAVGPRRDDEEFIQSLAKGLAVIESFGENNASMTLSEVARKTGLTPGSARRVLRTLQQLGYASLEGNRFQLMPRVLQLGYSYLSSLPFTSLVQPRLTKLMEEVDGDCSISVLDRTDVVYVARATLKRLGRDYMAVGTRYPAHGTSPGKLLLAALPEEEVIRRFRGREPEALTPRTINSLKRLLAELEKVRKAGWAVNDQETMMGHRSIAVPLTPEGPVDAALCVGCDISRANVETMIGEYLPKLRRAAATISKLVNIHAQSGATPLRARV